MLARLACALLLAAAFPAEARIDPVLYDVPEIPTTGDTCPTDADFQTARDAISADVLGILGDNIVPVIVCPLGQCEENPGDSCDQIYDSNPSSPSGYYWTRGCYDGPPLRVYCAMGNPCGCSGGPGGWKRIAYLNMTNTDSQCPHEWDFFNRDGVNIRVCERGLGRGGCGSALHKSDSQPYSRVCGRVIGYQFSSPDAFTPYINDRSLTIDDLYVDGVILTHGFAPRTHIWTFANGVDYVTGPSSVSQCPCDGPTTNSVVPPFIGNDWYCETGSPNVRWQRNNFYSNNPLWDGQGCPTVSTCCNHPPYFCKELPRTTIDDIELRLCADQGIGDETTAINFYEIYVQ